MTQFLHQGAIFGDESGLQLFWGEYTQLENRSSNPVIYSPDFNLSNKKPWYEFTNSVATTRATLANALSTQSFSTPTLSFTMPSAKSFEQQFSTVKEWINTQQIEKCVPFVVSTSESVENRHQFIGYVLKNLLEKSHGYVYGLWTDKEFIVGLTPELLVETTDYKNWQTMALAGTTTSVEFEKNPESFLGDDKESNEHNLVINFINQSLKPFGKINVGATTGYEIGGLVHLRTQMALAAEDETSLDEVVHALHPTPALGVYPKTDWQTRMASLNDHPRNRFGAPFGYAGNDRCQVVVAIRNLQERSGKYEIATGCGIVAQSKQEKEWQELLNKRQSVLGLLGL